MNIKIAQVFLALFVALCTVQALYWPIIMKPGTELYWWQNEIAAQIGYYLGLPVIVLSSMLQIPEFWHHLLVWVGVIVWGIVVYFAVGIVCRTVSKNWPQHNQSPESDA